MGDRGWLKTREDRWWRAATEEAVEEAFGEAVEKITEKAAVGVLVGEMP